ncbi:hypothetical protein EXIGLDRAFT_735312 [Exidia glandulosa HHB12029]|uniref:Uncharacterized protein n=1 Tax=Exidia glandulosa HHB12029 TaxID=1314781 RepID=A0A165JWG5_EXIGL|nr:hypothetical protein EXIGLDRAFT_735312 [Exidia glandulosa HHB12029]
MLASLVDLPHVSGTEGSSITNPAFIPQIMTGELAGVLGFIYEPWPGPKLTTLGLLRLLYHSARFGIARAREFALTRLKEIGRHVPAILRLEYGLLCNVDEWTKEAFNCLMLMPIHGSPDEAVSVVSPTLYAAVMNAHSEVDMLRRQNFVDTPPAVHDASCTDKLTCAKAWFVCWTGGVCREYLNPGYYATVAATIAFMDEAKPAGMNRNCLKATKDSVKAKGILTRETVLIDQMFEKLTGSYPRLSTFLIISCLRAIPPLFEAPPPPPPPPQLQNREEEDEEMETEVQQPVGLIAFN